MISKNTAMDIALAYREIEVAEKLLAEVTEALRRNENPDVRDAFGRLQTGLRLGVPSGENSHQMFNVPWTLAKPVIQAHIAEQRSILAALNAKATIEVAAP
jgi:hypothetical protein